MPFGRMGYDAPMTSNRLEAFSDGVIAILITIMVLELTVPHGTHLADLFHEWPVLVSYVLSFAYLAIYWVNHHHMLYVTERVDGTILWANMLLLFTLSLVPFATAWMGETGFAETPTAVYGVALLAAAVSYYVLQWAIIRSQGEGSVLKAAIGSDLKGKGSLVMYAVAIPSALLQPWVAYGLYAAVAAMWLIPDRRIERVVRAREDELRAADGSGAEGG
jgi:TMEM175 potassium channel family protein